MNIENIINQDDKIRKEAQIKDQKELKFLGSTRKIPGHTLFCINVTFIKPTNFWWFQTRRH